MQIAQLGISNCHPAENCRCRCKIWPCRRRTQPGAASWDNSRSGQIGITLLLNMNEPNENPRRYRWPWVAAAAVVLGIVLAIIWVGLAAKKVERERDLNAPLPGSAPGH